MAAGLPVRLTYGSLLKPTLNGVAVDGSYHCWVQFYAPRLGWIPLDVSLANIYGKATSTITSATSTSAAWSGRWAAI